MHEPTPEELQQKYAGPSEFDTIPVQADKYGIPKGRTRADFDQRGNLLPRNERRAQKRKRKKKGVKHGAAHH